MPGAPQGRLLKAGVQMSDGSPQGDGTRSPAPKTVVVLLPDEIDIVNSGMVLDSLTRALDNGSAAIVADAGRTVFCDCSGMGALMAAYHRAVASRTEFRVIASPAVQRVLELTGAAKVLQTSSTSNAPPLAYGASTPGPAPSEADGETGRTSPTAAGSGSGYGPATPCALSAPEERAHGTAER